MLEYPQALKVQEEKIIDSDEPASKKPRIYSYPKLLFEKLQEMADPVRKVCLFIVNGKNTVLYIGLIHYMLFSNQYNYL